MLGTGLLARHPKIAKRANKLVKHLYALRYGSHRERIGGEWDKMGPAQLAFMQSVGLKPHHKLLDVGCGSLRGGVHFIKYLDAGNYYGIEKEPDILEAGRKVEIPRYGLADKKPNLFAIDDFDISGIGVKFDYMFAHSVWSHLAPNQIEQCVDNLLPWLAPNGAFFVDYKEADAISLDRPHANRRNEISKARYPKSFFFDLAHRKGFAVEYIGDWPNHTKDKMLKLSNKV